MKLSTSFYDLVERCRKVTEKHIEKNRGPWTLSEQINLIHSEASEIYDVERRPKKYKVPELAFRVETCDVILAAITLLQLKGYPTDVIVESLNFTLKKVEKRVGIKK